MDGYGLSRPEDPKKPAQPASADERQEELFSPEAPQQRHRELNEWGKPFSWDRHSPEDWQAPLAHPELPDEPPMPAMTEQESFAQWRADVINRRTGRNQDALDPKIPARLGDDPTVARPNSDGRHHPVYQGQRGGDPTR